MSGQQPSHSRARAPRKPPDGVVGPPAGAVADSFTKEWADLVNEASPSEALVERVARWMHSSDPGRFQRMVGIAAVDKTKQIALYRDDWFELAGLSADQFDRDDVAKVLERCRLAVAVVGNQRVRRVGKAIYETGFVRQPSRNLRYSTRS
jgi:hypothetical protein